MKKIKLYGFNNLTKNLNFCIYDIWYTSSKNEKKKYIKYINNTYNSKKITKILKKICKIINANILNIAQQDYIPHGSSVNLLISENKININKKKILFHLDKSHICVHTYPESHPQKNTCTFRIDIEISTCGIISPLKSLNYILNEFKADIIIIDYKIKGFTRTLKGKKIFKDHKILSIQNFIDKKYKKKYDITDINLYQENIFNTKMILKKINYKKYIFYKKENKNLEKKIIISNIWKEMKEIYYYKNT